MRVGWEGCPDADRVRLCLITPTRGSPIPLVPGVGVEATQLLLMRKSGDAGQEPGTASRSLNHHPQGRECAAARTAYSCRS